MKKMLIRLPLTIAVAFCLTVQIYAVPVLPVQAQEIAREFCNAKQDNTRLLSNAQFALVKTYSATLENNTVNCFYVFQRPEERGFILVSADDRMPPVLGYSDSGTFDEATLPPALQYLLETYQLQFAYLDSQSTTLHDSQEPSLLPIPASQNFTAAVQPLLTTLWDQDQPYNLMCPQVGGNYTMTGCVATAMAQIMRYYKHPAQGTGSFMYTTASLRLNVSVNFGNTTYDWNNMLSHYSGAETAVQKNAVATLMFHCGAAVEMDYNVSASGSGLTRAATSLRDYFGYDQGIDIIQRDYYTYTIWDNIIKTELNAGRPVFYSGVSMSNTGHAFVVDGYDNSNLYHINWGWSGISNGYYALSLLSPSHLGIGGGTGGYNTQQSIIIGIKPAQTSSTPPIPQLAVDSVSADIATMSTLTGDFGIRVDTLRNIGNIAATSLRYGVVLCKESDNSWVKYVEGNLTISLPPNYYYAGKSWWLQRGAWKLPTDLAAGRYKLYPFYKPDINYPNPIYLYGINGKRHFVIVEVSATGSVAFTSSVENMPQLTLTQLSIDGNLYQGKTGHFQVSVKNTGSADYNSNMLILIENSTTNRQYLAPLPVVIPQGQTVTTDFYGTIDRSPGNYSVSLLYDAHNERSHFKTANAVQLGTAITAQIKNTPALGSIAATNPQFSNAGAVYAENVSFNTTISKTGDYYDGNVQALIMRNNGQGSLVSAAILENKYIVMDVGTNSKSFTFSGTLFDLATGDYYAMLNNGDWLGTGSKYTQFHLISPNSKLENDIEAEGIVLFYSPGSELLHIHSGLPIEKLSVISGNGKTVIHKPFIAQKECTVNISALPKGLYMVQATTLLGTKTLKYIKK